MADEGEELDPRYSMGVGGVPVGLPGWESAPCRLCGRPVLQRDDAGNFIESSSGPAAAQQYRHVRHRDCDDPAVIARDKLL